MAFQFVHTINAMAMNTDSALLGLMTCCNTLNMVALLSYTMGLVSQYCQQGEITFGRMNKEEINKVMKSTFVFSHLYTFPSLLFSLPGSV